jgi:ubiquinone/menaquinone biosynthesis C-methylase UbiE
MEFYEKYKFDDDFSDRPTILFQDEHLSYLDSCNTIIDLGCGNGRLVKKLKEKGKKSCGITYNRKEVEGRVTENIIYGDMHNIPFDNKSFDGFVMWDSLEHCASAYVALVEARRVLIEGGKGLIFMPGQNWLDCRVHICCYTVEQMKQLFRQASLKLVNVYEKQYDNKAYCEGMAVYEVVKDSNYNPSFKA